LLKIIDTIKYFLLPLLIFWLILLLEIGLFSRPSFFGHAPYLAFLFVFFFSFFVRQQETSPLFFSALAGGLVDVFSSFPFGVFTLSFFGLSLLVRRLSRLFDKKSALGFLLTFLGAFLFYRFFPFFAAKVFLLIFRQGINFHLNFHPVFFTLSFLVNLILGVVVFYLLCIVFKGEAA